MKRTFGNKKGATLIELIMVMVLLTLLGVTIYKLIDIANRTQEKIIANKNAQVDARIAISFLNVRLRQNDIKNKIKIKENKLSHGNAIVFEERSDEAEYDTWIYFHDKKLLQCIVDAGAEPDEVQGSPIASIDDFSIEYDQTNKTFKTKIFYSAGDSDLVKESLESIVYLEATQTGGLD